MRLSPLPEPEPEDADEEEEELVDITRDGQARRFGHTAWVPVGAASARERRERTTSRRRSTGECERCPIIIRRGDDGLTGRC